MGPILGFWVLCTVAFLVSGQVSLSDSLRFTILVVGFARRLSCLVKFHANWLWLHGIVLPSLVLFLVLVIRDSDMFTR